MTVLNTNLIFGALTRPSMYLGVTTDYFAFMMMLTLCAFIGSGKLSYGLLYLPLHAFGWLVCKYDPHFFTVIAVRLKLPNTPNKSLWGVKCYEPF